MAPGIDTVASTYTMALLVNDITDDDFFDEDHYDDDDQANDVLLTFSPTLAGIMEDEENMFDEVNGSAQMTKNPDKAVKFADDEEKKLDDRLDKERSRHDLLSKIARLTDLLKEAEKDLATEKEKRRKKEKNLMKLAKELKKRMSQKEKDIDRMEELEEKKKYLEHHWVLAQKELDQEKALRSKLQIEAQKEFEQSLLEERTKYAKTVEEHEGRLADLKKAHAQQCDELCREVLKANLEADRLHSKLKSQGVHVPRRALFKDKATSNGHFIPFLATSITVFFAIFVVLGFKVALFSKSGFCAPIMPGMELSDSTIEQTFLAPWWAPPSFKEQAFAIFCSPYDNERSRSLLTSLEWKRDGKNNKLVLNVDGKVKLKRTVSKAEITGSNIRLWKRNGHAEDLGLLW